MPTIQTAPATDDYVLAEDFLSLDHWREYGNTTSDYRLDQGMSLGYGGSLHVPEEGFTRLVRETQLAPGETYVFTWRAHPQAGASIAPALQLTNPSGSNFVLISPTEGLSPGWNHIISRVTTPSSWTGVLLRAVKHNAQGGGGWVHRIRATHVTEEEDSA